MEYLKRFGIRLLLCFIPISWFSFLLTPLTVYGSYIFLLIFFDVIVNENILIVNGFPFRIIEACVASAAYYLFWLLCLLTKNISLMKRIKIIVYGFLLIFGMNVLRIILLIFLAMNYGFNYFHVVHLIFWSFVTGVYVALVWILLVKHYKIKNIPIYSDLKTIYVMGFKK